MVISAKGTFYAPSPPPQSGGEQAMRDWCVREFGRIATAIKSGRADYLSLDLLGALPQKPFAGMVAYFEAGIAGAGEGEYEFRSDNAWHKL